MNDSFSAERIAQSKPYNRTVKLARNAHRFYAELVRRDHNAGYTNRVDAITRRQLNKAANALADLIRAL